jgi:hypothetical protein
MHNLGFPKSQSCLLWIFIFLGITTAALDVPSLNAFLDKQGLSGLNDYYDRGDREIERIRLMLSKSASQFSAKAASTINEIVRSAPDVCDRFIRAIPAKQLAGTSN